MRHSEFRAFYRVLSTAPLTPAEKWVGLTIASFFYNGGQRVSRSKISEQVGLSPSRVSAITARLVEEGIITKQTTGRSSVFSISGRMYRAMKVELLKTRGQSYCKQEVAYNTNSYPMDLEGSEFFGNEGDSGKVAYAKDTKRKRKTDVQS